MNGLPHGVIELKNPADPDATVLSAWNQLQTYKAELPSLFAMNELMTVGDGVEARVGTLTAGWEWFKRWRTISGEEKAAPSSSQLQVAIEGLCAPERLLAYLRDFIVFEDDGSGKNRQEDGGISSVPRGPGRSRGNAARRRAGEPGGESRRTAADLRRPTR